MISKKLERLLYKINSEFHGCYLVGGILRDFYLFKKISTSSNILDIDVIIKDLNYKKLEKIVHEFKLPFIVLDEENKVYRTVIKEDCQINIDFSSYVDLGEDIKRRDFTINCLLLELKHFIEFLKKNNKRIVFENIIDKLNAKKDIKQKVLKVVTKQVFIDDPLRILRAARFSCVYGFKIDESIDKLVIKYKHLLKKVSYERITEELKKIFNSNSYHIFEWLDKNKVIDILFPEVAEVKRKGKNTQFRKFYFHKEGLWQHIKLTYKAIEDITNNLKKFYPYHFKILSQHIKDKVYLLKYISLFHDIAKPSVVSKQDGKVRFFHHEIKSAEMAQNILQRIKLSNEEIKIITEVIKNHMRIGGLHANKNVITERAYFRLFRDTEKSLHYLLIFCLADRLSYETIPLKERKKYFKKFYTIKDFLKFENLILKKYDEYLKKNNLPKLLNGNEVMKIFKIEEGPLVGKVLNFIRELQLMGKIHTKEEAIKTAKRYIRTLSL